MYIRKAGKATSQNKAISATFSTTDKQVIIFAYKVALRARKRPLRGEYAVCPESTKKPTPWDWLFRLVGCVRLELVGGKFFLVQVHKGKDFLRTGVGHIAEI